ncbi:MAG: DUF5658 family protein [Candidatus Cloacimonetes bacterium]|nr:DUF5658 family protein [Candidatus Cloacimonadota bacterium]
MLHWLINLYLNPYFTFVQTLAFILLNALDGHSTYLVLKPSHYEREKNPIARWFFKKLQIPDGIIVFKTLLLFGLILCISYYAAWEPLTINIVLSIANLIFAYVVWHNYRVYRRLPKYFDLVETSEPPHKPF